MANEDEAPIRARGRRQAGGTGDDRRGWIWLLALLEVVGIVLLATGRGAGFKGFLTIVGATFVIAAAAIAVGGVFGLLFGLPRARGTERPESALGELTAWLPLLMVGAGLIEARKLVGWIGAQGARTAAVLGFDGATGGTLAVAIIVFNLLFGFLVFFIYVRPQERPAPSEVSTGSLPPDATLRAATTAASVLGALNQPPPGGYEQAIREARAFLRDPANERNGTMWMYLACGYGQKHAALQASATSAELGRLVQGALDAVRKARRYDPDLKDTMRPLWDPDDEAHIEGENDLQSFYEDPRLRELFAQELL